MNSRILNYIEKCESWKVAIKNLHWSASNMSQHELCDDIASEISDFEDLVSEVEQSITGKIKLNGFTPKSYKINTLKSFVEDVISDSQAFLKELGRMGEKYIGIKSECESFIGVMQRKLYLVNFTMKEEIKNRLKASISENYRKEENIKTTFHGTKPSTERGLFKRINDLTKNGQLNTRTFDGVSDAIDFYRKILGNIGTLRYIDACEDDNYVVKLETEGGRSYYGIMRTKDVGDNQCKASITFSPHSSGDDKADVDPEDNEPVIEDGNDWEEEHLEKARKGLRKRDEENFYQRHPDFKSNGGSVEEGRLMEYMNPNGDLDDPISPYSNSAFDYNGDKGKEIAHSWDRFDNKPIARSSDDFMHGVKRNEAPYETDKAINRRDRERYFTDYENNQGRDFMNNWINGKKELPMESRERLYKLTENELRQLVSDAVMTLIDESRRLDKSLINVTNLIKSAHGRGKKKKKDITPEEWEEFFKHFKIKEPAKTNESIEIKPENKGKFNATKKATGKSTEELTHSKNPLTRKRAIFAQNAKRWSKK